MAKPQLEHVSDDGAGPGAARAGEARHRGPGESPVSRSGWKTIGIQVAVFDEIASKRVPNHSKSVQAYVHHWIRIGLMVDAALDSVDDQTSLAERLLELLSEPSDASPE